MPTLFNHSRKLLHVAAIFLSLFFLSCNITDQSETVNITFRVIVRKDSGISRVCIAGNQKILGDWNAGKVSLTQVNDTLFSRTFALKKEELIGYKFTLGSWSTEALDENLRVPENSRLKPVRDSVITAYVKNWRSSIVDDGIFITENLLPDFETATILDGNWKFSENDSSAFSRNDYNDSHWLKYNLSFFPLQSDARLWWFRMKLTVDSSLFGKSFAVNIEHLGASEVFFNGRKIFKSGVPSSSPDSFESYQNRQWYALTFDNRREQFFTVKYANHDIAYQSGLGFNSGFVLSIANINQALIYPVTRMRINSIYQALYTLIPLILVFIHLLLFWFYRKSVQNLYYAICLFGFASLSYCNIEKFIATDPDIIIMLYRLAAPSVATSIYFGILTGYIGMYEKLPKRRFFFLTISVIVGIWGFFDFSKFAVYALYFLLGATVYEYFYIFFKRKSMTGGINRLISVAFVILLLSIFYQIFLDFDILPSLWGFTMVYGIGLLALIVAMSISLSYDFAHTNKSLEKQLEISLRQDSELREREVEKRILEADNKRKTEELEAAREQQLSFLPKDIPQIPGYEIAVFMQTATEVGGDYYDFYTNDGELTFVIGDATGHGAKAGIMVAATKSLFSLLATENEPLSIIRKFNAALKSMNLRNLYMGLTAGKLRENKLTFSNAGMPPFIYYNDARNVAEEIILKSMPLGGFINFPYEEKELNIEQGDILLFMSDGYTEHNNHDDQLLGSESAKAVLKNQKDSSASVIINSLLESMKFWSVDSSFRDDVTFLVIKRC
ncbi:MAG: SpoIIE family protein phosphatase [Ignavibacteriaceae bacterium]